MTSWLCPSLEEMTAFNAGRIFSDARLKAIAEHIETCPTCLDLLRSLPEDSSWFHTIANDDGSTVNYAEEPQFREALSWIEAIPRRTAGDSPEVSQIGDYEILEVLGRGGMGTVYKAWHPRLQRVVVLKTIREHSAKDPVAVEQFRREMAAVGRLDHPAIVKAYDVEDHCGREYLVMEYVPGEDLRSILRSEGILTLADACAVIHEVALGLQHLHERGFVHRDIKPSNIVVSAERAVKILDLGLAFHAQESARPSIQSNEGVLGTLDYMAPEQTADSLQVDAAADLYSLGATLFALLTGKPPFADYKSRAEKIRAVCEVAPARLTTVRSDVPNYLAMLVSRLLNKSPQERLSAAKEVADTLRPLARRSTLVRISEPSTINSKSLNRPVAVGLTVLVLLAVTSALLLPYIPSIWQSAPAPTTVNSTPEKPAAVEASIVVERPRYAAWNMGSTGSMLAGLAAIPPKFTDISRWQVETVSPRGTVRAIAVGPDGKHIALVGDDENVRVFRRANAGIELVQILPTTLSNVACNRSLAWSPDGQLLAVSVAGGDRPVEIWEWEQGLRKFELRGHMSGVTAVAWNSTGTLLATAGLEGRLRVWSRDGLIKHTFDVAGSSLTALAWHPSLDQVAIGGRDGTLTIFDAQLGTATTSLEKQASPILALAWRPQGDQLVAVTEDHRLLTFEPQISSSVHKSISIQTPFHGLVWSSDGSVLHVVASTHLKWDRMNDSLVVGSSNGVADTWVAGCWSAPTNSLLLASASGTLREVSHQGDSPHDLYRAPHTYLCDLAWNRESTRLAVCSIDGGIQIWGGQGRPMGVVATAKPTSGIGFRSVAWSLGGEYIAAADHPPTNTVHVWDAKSFQELAVFQHGTPVQTIAWSDDARWLVSVGPDGRVCTWDVVNKTSGEIFTKHQSYVTTVSTAPHTRRFATGDLSGFIHAWEIDDAGAIQPIAELPKQSESVWSVAWGPQGDYLAVAGTHHVWLVQASTGEILWTRATNSPPGRVYWKLDRRRLYCNGIGVLDANTGDVLTPLAAYPQPASYSPDGRWVAETQLPRVVTVHHASNQIPHWRGVPLDRKSSVTFAPSGQIDYATELVQQHLAGNQAGATGGLPKTLIVYVVETSNGKFETLSPSEFERRIDKRISK